MLADPLVFLLRLAAPFNRGCRCRCAAFASTPLPASGASFRFLAMSASVRSTFKTEVRYRRQGVKRSSSSRVLVRFPFFPRLYDHATLFCPQPVQVTHRASLFRCVPSFICLRLLFKPCESCSKTDPFPLPSCADRSPCAFLLFLLSFLPLSLGW